MLDFLISILFFFIGLLLGFYLLLLGRRTMVLTTAIICLASVGSLLALIFVDGASNGWALTEEPNWLLLGITVAAGVIGGILGAQRQHIAAAVIGFFAGGYMGLWLYDIAFYLVIDIAHLPQQTALWVGVGILVISGLIGLYLTRRSEAVAVILISVFVGVDLIIRALGLSPSKSFTAVITLSLALLGLVVQYAQYLREIKAEMPHTVAEVGVAPAPELFDLSED